MNTATAVGAGDFEGGALVSLLDKALEAKVSIRQKKGASADELELAVALMRGHVSGAQVMAALGQKSDSENSAAKAWAWRVLRAGLTDGRLTLTIETESDEDAEFDKKHEAAKVAPLAAGAVRR